MHIDLELTTEQAEAAGSIFPAESDYNMTVNQAMQTICNQIREQTPPSVGDIVHTPKGFEAERKMYVVAIADDVDGTQVWCRDTQNVLDTYALDGLSPGARP